MAPPQTTRPLLAVSLKMYLSAARTRAWVHDVAARVGRQGLVDVAVLPSFPLLESTAATCAGTTVQWGAQDVAPTCEGAQTGEVGAPMLVELGCTYAEIGHAERRSLFGESNAMVVAKLVSAMSVGLTPILCVGENRHLSSHRAADAVRVELEELLHSATSVGGPLAPVVVAYEPVWAIGAQQPAPPGHVIEVARALRGVDTGHPLRIIYGGAAGARTLDELWPHVDGLFLGRFAHDPQVVTSLVDRATVLLSS